MPDRNRSTWRALTAALVLAGVSAMAVDAAPRPGTGGGVPWPQAMPDVTLPRSGASEAHPATAPQPPTGVYNPTLGAAAGDVTALHRAGCQQNKTGFKLIICVRGDTDGRRTAMLAGGSHATHIYPAVNSIARDRGWRLLTAVKAGCRLDLEQAFTSSTRHRSCKAWLDALVARIRRNPPDIFITTGTITSTTSERLPSGYISFWRLLNRLGVKVIAVRDTPRATFDHVTCLREHPRRPQACEILREASLDATSPLVSRSDELPGNVVAVDLTGAICTDTVCPAVSGSYVIYRDRHHFTATFARRLASTLRAQIP
jgi:hypothetical protein